MPASYAPPDFLPYVVVEVEPEWREATDTKLPRWVIVDGRGETVSNPVPSASAFKWCAALMWWLAQAERQASSRPNTTPVALLYP